MGGRFFVHYFEDVLAWALNMLILLLALFNILYSTCFSCGDGTLGGPAQRGDNYECRNMKLLLKQQQRVICRYLFLFEIYSLCVVLLF